MDVEEFSLGEEENLSNKDCEDKLDITSSPFVAINSQENIDQTQSETGIKYGSSTKIPEALGVQESLERELKKTTNENKLLVFELLCLGLARDDKPKGPILRRVQSARSILLDDDLENHPSPRLEVSSTESNIASLENIISEPTRLNSSKIAKNTDIECTDGEESLSPKELSSQEHDSLGSNSLDRAQNTFMKILTLHENSGYETSV